MELTCTQENLSHGLNIAARLSDKNINLPILNNVLLQARKDGLTVIATNLEIGIKTKIRGKIEKEGDLTVPARLLTEFVNTLKKENIEITGQENSLTITGENHQTAIRGMDASDFPVLPEVSNEFSLTIPADDLRKALGQVLFAVSADESRPELNGVFMRIEANRLILAATDSYRLSEKTINLEKASAAEREIIIPSKSMVELSRILEFEDADSVLLAINENQILATCGNTELVSRLVAGAYPDYRQIIPRGFQNDVSFSIADMTRAVKSTALFCKQGINDVKLSLDKRFTDIAVSAENSIHGKNTSNVPSLSKNQALDIVFNYRFLLDGLSHLGGETAALKTNDPTSPAMLTDPSDASFTYIIMPIKQ